MKLIAVPRPQETNHGNLFVRLSPQTAYKLYEVALQVSNLQCNNQRIEDAFLSSVAVDDVIEFLPLELTFQTRNGRLTVYGSYNGGSPALSSVMSGPYQNGNTDGIIEISLDLHPELKEMFNTSSDQVIVSVRAIPYVPVAKQVTFEPLTTSDWEMIEMEASILEDGGLLNQITVVYPGQVLPLRLIPLQSELNRSFKRMETDAWIKVVEDHNAADQRSTDSESDSDSSFENGNEMNLNAKFEPCFRLMAETEVVVIPKPRVKEPENTQVESKPLNQPSQPFRVQPTAIDYEDSELVKTHLPAPKLAHIHVHPSTAVKIPGYKYCCSDKEFSLTVIVKKAKSPHSQEQSIQKHVNFVVATMSIDDRTQIDHIALHPLLRYQLLAHVFEDWLSIQLVPDSYIESRCSRLRDSIAHGRETINMRKVSLVVERTLSPWRLPEIDQTGTFGYYQNIPCRADAYDGLALFSQGSLISSNQMRIFGIEVQECPNEIYRVEFRGNDIIDPIVRAGDLVQLLDFDDDKDYEDTTVYEESTANEESSLGSDSNQIGGVSNRIVLPEQSLLVSGFLSTSASSIEETVITAARGIVSGSTSLLNRNPLVKPRQIFIGITGEEGAGKSYSVVRIASKMSLLQNCAVVHMSCKPLQASSRTTLIMILEETQRVFSEAMRKQPSVLIFDDLDCLIPNIESGDSDVGSMHHQTINPVMVGQAKVIVDHLILLSAQTTGVVCMCTFKDNSSISSRILELFHSLVEVPPLDAKQRTDFLCRMLLDEETQLDEAPNFITRLGRLTDGYRPVDMKKIAKQILNAKSLRNLCNPANSLENLLNLETDIDDVLKDFVPISQQSSAITQNDRAMDWHSIGGLFKAKQSLHETVIHPMKFKRVYSSAPTKLPTGLMIFGPPGCGKSFIVPSLAKISNLNLITCRGPELLDRYIGASEAKVRQLFARAAAASPSLLFFDEFDSLAPQRGSDHTGVTDRVVNQLLTLLDGAEQNEKLHVFVVAATSRPDKIDNALLRPGRLEKHVYVGYPESQSERSSLFSSMLMNWNVDIGVKRLFEQRGDVISFFCKDCDGVNDFCAADFKAVLDTAHLIAVHEILNIEDERKESLPQVVIQKQHISDAFSRTRPSLLPGDKVKFERYCGPFLGKKISHSEEVKLKTSLK